MKIVDRKFDLKYNFLRTTHYWYRIFSGRYLDEPGVNGKRKDIDTLFLDVLTANNIIYSGFLAGFNYSSSKDALENIILKAVTKKKFAVGKEQLVKDIPSDFFIIQGAEIKNINVFYLELEGEIPSDLPEITDNEPNIDIDP